MEFEYNSLVTQQTNLLFKHNRGVYMRFIETAPVFHEETERLEINRYWRAQLSTLESDTRDIRACLDDHSSDSEWLYAFENHVIPVLVANDLPK